MEIKPTVMVIADISGYTKFMSLHRVALLHAEVIITDLLETVTHSAQFPLKLNKLEGDAAFLYCDEVGDDPAAAINDIGNQIVIIMNAFADKHRLLSERSVGGCVCDACRHIGDLRLKAFAHYGDVVIKTTNGFTELGGEAPIVIHRMTKNNIHSDEYVMASADFFRHLSKPVYPHEERGTESYDSIGDVDFVAYFPEARDTALPDVPRLTRLTGIVEALRLFVVGIMGRGWRSKRAFANLPT